MDRKSKKRLRVFAGPNGSGKSTLAIKLKENADTRIKLGIFVNADEIEQQLNSNKSLALENYGLHESSESLQDFIRNKGMSLKKLSDSEIHKQFRIQNNKIYFSGEYNSYIAADIASFIRSKLLKTTRVFHLKLSFLIHQN